jgi:hypothetical protein
MEIIYAVPTVPIHVEFETMRSQLLPLPPALTMVLLPRLQLTITILSQVDVYHTGSTLFYLTACRIHQFRCFRRWPTQWYIWCVFVTTVFYVSVKFILYSAEFSSLVQGNSQRDVAAADTNGARRHVLPPVRYGAASFLEALNRLNEVANRDASIQSPPAPPTSRASLPPVASTPLPSTVSAVPSAVHTPSPAHLEHTPTPAHPASPLQEVQTPTPARAISPLQEEHTPTPARAISQPSAYSSSASSHDPFFDMPCAQPIPRFLPSYETARTRSPSPWPPSNNKAHVFLGIHLHSLNVRKSFFEANVSVEDRKPSASYLMKQILDRQLSQFSLEFSAIQKNLNLLAATSRYPKKVEDEDYDHFTTWFFYLGKWDTIVRETKPDSCIDPAPPSESRTDLFQSMSLKESQPLFVIYIVEKASISIILMWNVLNLPQKCNLTQVEEKAPRSLLRSPLPYVRALSPDDKTRTPQHFLDISYGNHLTTLDALTKSTYAKGYIHCVKYRIHNLVTNDIKLNNNTTVTVDDVIQWIGEKPHYWRNVTAKLKRGETVLTRLRGRSELSDTQRDDLSLLVTLFEGRMPPFCSDGGDGRDVDDLPSLQAASRVTIANIAALCNRNN